MQISFSPQWIFFAGDSGNGTVWVLDLQHLQPIWAATNYHATMPVPGGSSGGAFYRNAFYGSVDAATGVYYASTTQGTSSGGNTKGLFALPAVGGKLQFVDFNASGTEVFIAGGRVWSGLQLPVAALAVFDSDDVALAVSDSDDVALAEPVALTYTGRRG